MCISCQRTNDQTGSPAISRSHPHELKGSHGIKTQNCMATQTTHSHASQKAIMVIQHGIHILGIFTNANTRAPPPRAESALPCYLRIIKIEGWKATLRSSSRFSLISVCVASSGIAFMGRSRQMSSLGWEWKGVEGAWLSYWAPVWDGLARHMPLIRLVDQWGGWVEGKERKKKGVSVHGWGSSGEEGCHIPLTESFHLTCTRQTHITHMQTCKSYMHLEEAWACTRAHMHERRHASPKIPGLPPPRRTVVWCRDCRSEVLPSSLILPLPFPFHPSFPLFFGAPVHSSAHAPSLVPP